jgi:hypothetical protein
MMATKPLCPTCGYKIPRKGKQVRISENVQTQEAPSFWSKMLKLNFTSPASEKTKSA